MYDFSGDLCIDETRGSVSVHDPTVHDPTVRKPNLVTGKRSRLDMLLAASGVELIKQTEVSDHLTFCSTQVESPLLIERSNLVSGDLPFSVVRTCPVKFQNRERGIEFCRSRKIIKLVFIQGQVRLRHFLGRALWLGQARGPSAAATCLTLKTSLAASLYADISQVLFSGSTKFNPPLSVLEFYGALHTTGIPLYLFSGCPFYTAECQD